MENGPRRSQLPDLVGRFGPAPVTLDPFPGSIGGHVGGTIDLGNGSVKNALAMQVPPALINDIFISHLHGDHYADLPYMYPFTAWSGRWRPDRLRSARIAPTKIERAGDGLRVFCSAMEAAASARADLLYRTIDESNGFYLNPVGTASRSNMNVVFQLSDCDTRA